MMRLNSYEGKRLLSLARGGDYAHWYANLATRIHGLQSELIQECGIETWEYAANFYDIMHEALKIGSIGGAIIYARRMPGGTRRVL